MKRVLSVILVVAITACVGMSFTGCSAIFDSVSESIGSLMAPKLDKAIVGTWVSENGLTCTFREDGSWSGNISGLSIVSLNGTYTVDNENNKVTLTYTLMSTSVSKELDAVIEEDVLTVTTDSLLGSEKVTTVYNRQVAE